MPTTNKALLYEELEHKITSPNSIGPINKHNSCFLDSVLVALLFPDSVFVNLQILQATIPSVQKAFVFGSNADSDYKYRQETQKSIQQITQMLRQPQTSDSNNDITVLVQHLRHLLHQGNFASLFNNGQQQDASEFMYAVFDIFHLNNNINSRKTTISGANDLLGTPAVDAVITVERIESAGVVLHVPQWSKDTKINQLINTRSDVLLETPYTAKDKQQYTRLITEVTYLPSLFFVIHIDRTLTPMKNLTPIQVTESVSTNGRLFHLMSVVLHDGTMRGGHYTSLIRTTKDTYKFYNGSNSSCTVTNIKEAQFSDMVESMQLNTRGTLFFYTS